ncbi:MAG TPA: hypothetical protein VNT55_03575 [Baekduia sp.]|nr:hypothetical protein [Baekduia sp.]
MASEGVDGVVASAGGSDIVAERVAAQAAVLSALRQAAGGTAVWPWCSMADLRLSDVDAVAVARVVSTDLQVEVVAADLVAETVGALVDRLLALTGA